MVVLIDEAVAAGAGPMAACEQAGIDRRARRRWLDEATGEVRADRRPEAVRPLPSHTFTEQERQAILLTCQLPRFVDVPPSRIVPTFADEGVYLGSEASPYWILRAADQQHERGGARRRTSSTATSHRATGPNQVWSWDMTWLGSPVRMFFYYLYAIVDLWSFEDRRLGCSRARNRRARRDAAVAGGTRRALSRHEPGAARRERRSAEVLDAARDARPTPHPQLRQPIAGSGDNPYSKSLFRTTNNGHDYPAEGSADIEAARTWVCGFVRWYNDEHYRGATCFISPRQRHDGRDVDVLVARQRVYEETKRKDPSCWYDATRNWAPPKVVRLNPERPARSDNENESIAA